MAAGAYRQSALPAIEAPPVGGLSTLPAPRRLISAPQRARLAKSSRHEANARERPIGASACITRARGGGGGAACRHERHGLIMANVYHHRG